jgi:hypothetical protein
MVHASSRVGATRIRSANQTLLFLFFSSIGHAAFIARYSGPGTRVKHCPRPPRRHTPRVHVKVDRTLPPPAGQVTTGFPDPTNPGGHFCVQRPPSISDAQSELSTLAPVPNTAHGSA